MCVYMCISIHMYVVTYMYIHVYQVENCTCTQVQHIPGVLIYRFQAPLCFVNGKVFRSRLEMAANLDKKGMNKREPGCIEQLVSKVRCLQGTL